MTLEEFGALIGTIGIEAVYGYYKEAQAAPYITYAATEKNCIYADGRCIYSEDWIVLRLVSQARDTASEALIEQTLTDSGLAYGDPELDFDEKQGIHTTIYYFQLE